MIGCQHLAVTNLGRLGNMNWVRCRDCGMDIGYDIVPESNDLYNTIAEGDLSDEEREALILEAISEDADGWEDAVISLATLEGW